LLDEPLGAIDFQMRELLQEELAALVEGAKTTVVMVTHDVNESVYLSDRVIVMSANKGRIIKDAYIDLPRSRSRQSKAFKEHVFELTDLVRQAFQERDCDRQADISVRDMDMGSDSNFIASYNRMHSKYTNVANGRSRAAK
jgi:ABC-type sulfate/molybdate transport systems ATPase subunit